MSDYTGVPPVPPPGGYGRRVIRPDLPGESGTIGTLATGESLGLRPASEPGAGGAGGPGGGGRSRAPKPRVPVAQRLLGWGALTAAIVIAAVILIISFSRGNRVELFSATLLVVFAAALVLAVAAAIVRGSRTLGVVGLVVLLFVNPLTAGGVVAVTSASTGSYESGEDSARTFWEKYPGVRDRSGSEVLAQPSLEQVQAEADALIAQVREALTAEMGLQWQQGADAGTTYARNGYGGESMLQDLVSQEWVSTSPVTSTADKQRVLDVIDGVLAANGLSSVYTLSEPGGGIDDATLEKFYGSADPDEQVIWTSYAYMNSDDELFWIDIIDLSNDDAAGTFRTQRESINQLYGSPLEGVFLYVQADNLLAEADRDDFETAIEPYE